MVGTATTTKDSSLSQESLLRISPEPEFTSTTKMSLNFLPATETKSGCLMLVMGARRQRLQVKIYGNTLDPFAAFYPDKKHCRHCGVMKLRGCRVEPVPGTDTDFRVIPKSTDGGRMLQFGADTLAEKKDWLEAFSVHSVETDVNGRARSVSLRQFRMPSLPEMEEEGCSDSSDIEHEHEDEDSFSSTSSASPSSSSRPRQIPPRSRHNFIQNLDKYGCRPRCCSHPGPVSRSDFITKC